jgi:hypothetical protein
LRLVRRDARSVPSCPEGVVSVRGVPALAGLALALAPVAVPAHAAAAPKTPKACTALTDDTWDVGPADATAETVPDLHLDLLDVTMRATSAALVVVVRDQALDSLRRGRWTVEFAVRGTRMYVTADLGAWEDMSGAGGGDGTVTYRAGFVGGPERGISGKFDYALSTVTLTVPYATYRGVLRPTSLLRNVQAESRETFLVTPPSAGRAGRETRVALADTAVRREPLALSSCRG